MGLRCSCGVSSILPFTDTVLFEFEDGTTHQGSATFSVNVCADIPEIGSVTLIFSDNDPPNRSFTFTSTAITSVICSPLTGGGCLAIVTGQGIVTGETQTRMFTVRFQEQPPNVDIASEFTIEGFAVQTAAAIFVNNNVFTIDGCE